MSTAYIFYGKSGCGKGTQANLLKSKLEQEGRAVLMIETGKLFRSFTADRQDFMGEHVKSVIDAGGLMPAFFPVYLWAKELVDSYDGTQDIIFDGVSRRIEEASILDSALEFLNITKRNVIHIDVTDAWVFEHMGARSDRKDDTVSGMAQRLTWYTEQVLPVIEYFKQHPEYTVVLVNGEQSIEKVAGDIQTGLEHA